MNAPDIHLRRIVLRGTAEAVARARTELPAMFARSRWPIGEDGGIVIVRRIAVRATLSELPTHAAALTAQLAKGAADPWSATADNADAVRFRNALEYRACLIRDLLAGTATQRWLWRHRHALFELSPAARLATVLAEDALALPALLEHAALHTALPALWRAIDAPAATALLHAIASASGWHSAISAALEARADERSADIYNADWERSGGEPAGWSPPSSSIADPSAASSLTYPSARSRDLADRGSPVKLRSMQPRPVPDWQALRGSREAIRGLPPKDSRVVLQAVLGLWLKTPAALRAADSGEHLRDAARSLVQSATSALPHVRTERKTTAAAVGARPTVAQPSPHAVARSRRESAVDPLPQPAHTSSTMSLPSAAEHEVITRGGSVFFLLNVLNLPALREWRSSLLASRAGWHELVRLALRIGTLIDPPLAAFLVRVCGLNADSTPAAALATLGPSEDGDAVDAAALRYYGDAALAALRSARPARIRATASTIDVHLVLADLSIEIRRTGLDIDPGWLPWLGCVVRFHYQQQGIA